VRIDGSVRRRLWLQNLWFSLLIASAIGLLAWLSTRYPVQADWTANHRNTLSPASQTLLTHLAGPVRVTAYARENPALRDAIARLVHRYQRYKPDLTLHFVNPDLLPDRVRELGVTRDGELYVEYAGRGAKLQQLSEQAFTQTLQRLSQRRELVVRFLDGHGERKPLGVANADLGSFGRELERNGLQIHPLDLAMDEQVSAATAAVVIAGPRTPLSPGEVTALLAYVRQGGHLLWLLEPGDSAGLRRLAALLGVTALPGVVVDADTPGLGIKNPTFIPIADYGPHPITETLRSPALLPRAVALDVLPPAGWTATVLLQSQPRSWTEVAPLDGVARFDPDSAERIGPLTIGVALVRPLPGASANDAPVVTSQQRIVIVGDGDFLSNTYLGNGANLELGLRMMHWLTLDEAPITIVPRAVPDPNLNLSDGALAVIATVFLLGLPGGLLLSGWLIGLRRRRH
jgi:ABC-type uncharacterized transport system involved in gliding motility auxiliary subunit